MPLNASRQTAVQFRQPLCFCQGGDGSQDTFIPNGTGGLAFTLNLEIRKVQVRGSDCPLRKGVVPGEDYGDTLGKALFINCLSQQPLLHRTL